jgi:hypothetical protein
MADENIPHQKKREPSGRSAASFAKAALSGWGLPSIDAPDFRKEVYPPPRAVELQSTLSFIFSEGITTYTYPSLHGLVFSEQEMHIALADALKADFNVFQADHRQSPPYLDRGIVALASDPAFISASRTKDRGAQMAIALKRIADARPPVQEAVPEPVDEGTDIDMDSNPEQEEITQVVKMAGIMESVPLPAPSYDAVELSKELAYKLDMLLSYVHAIPDNERPNVPSLIHDAFEDAYRRYWAIDKKETYPPFTHARNLIDAIHAYDTTLRKLASLYPETTVGLVEKVCLIGARNGPLDEAQLGQVLELAALDMASQHFWPGYFPSSQFPALAVKRSIELVADMDSVDAGSIAFMKMPAAVCTDIASLRQAIQDEMARRMAITYPGLDKQTLERRSKEDLALMKELVQGCIILDHGVSRIGDVDPKVSGMVDSMINEVRAADPRLKISKSGLISAAAIRVVEGVRKNQDVAESWRLQKAYNRPLACLLQSYSREAVLASAERMMAGNKDLELPPLRDAFDSELEALLPKGKENSRFRQVARSLNYFVYSMSSHQERQRIWGDACPGANMAVKKKVN